MNNTVRKPTLKEIEELSYALDNLIKLYHNYSCIQIIETNNVFKCILLEYTPIDSEYKLRTKVCLTEYYSNLFLLLFYHTGDYKEYINENMYKIMFTLEDWKEMLDEIK